MAKTNKDTSESETPLQRALRALNEYLDNELKKQ